MNILFDTIVNTRAWTAYPGQKICSVFFIHQNARLICIGLISPVRLEIFEPKTPYIKNAKRMFRSPAYDTQLLKSKSHYSAVPFC